MLARENLKDFRLLKRMSQDRFAKEIGYSRGMYQQVENGERDGTQEFWTALQKRFNVEDQKMWSLMKKTEKRG